MGPLTVGDETRQALVNALCPERRRAALRHRTEERQASAVRVGRMLQLIVASKEYQFA